MQPPPKSDHTWSHLWCLRPCAIGAKTPTLRSSWSPYRHSLVERSWCVLHLTPKVGGKPEERKHLTPKLRSSGISLRFPHTNVFFSLPGSSGTSPTIMWSLGRSSKVRSQIWSHFVATSRGWFSSESVSTSSKNQSDSAWEGSRVILILFTYVVGNFDPIGFIWFYLGFISIYFHERLKSFSTGGDRSQLRRHASGARDWWVGYQGTEKLRTFCGFWGRWEGYGWNESSVWMLLYFPFRSFSLFACGGLKGILLHWQKFWNTNILVYHGMINQVLGLFQVGGFSQCNSTWHPQMARHCFSFCWRFFGSLRCEGRKASAAHPHCPMWGLGCGWAARFFGESTSQNWFHKKCWFYGNLIHQSKQKLDTISFKTSLSETLAYLSPDRVTTSLPHLWGTWSMPVCPWWRRSQRWDLLWIVVVCTSLSTPTDIESI